MKTRAKGFKIGSFWTCCWHFPSSEVTGSIFVPGKRKALLFIKVWAVALSPRAHTSP